MHRPGVPIAALLLLVTAGCQCRRPYGGEHDGEMFGPVSIRIHPTFTKVRDWTGDNTPDGIEALLELRNQFEEPTRATGRVIFELFEYRRDFPNPAGKRLVNPWITSLVTFEDQQARWSRELKMYTFQLAFPQVQTGRSYVLTASFELQGGRLFDRVILEPRGEQQQQQQQSEQQPGQQP